MLLHLYISLAGLPALEWFSLRPEIIHMFDPYLYHG